MKLLELVPLLKDFTRIRRTGWDFFLVKSECEYRALIKIDTYSLQMEEFKLTYRDLIADNWEIVE